MKSAVSVALVAAAVVVASPVPVSDEKVSSGLVALHARFISRPRELLLAQTITTMGPITGANLPITRYIYRV